MMVRSKRLSPIKRLADNKESEAAQSFSEAREALSSGQLRLEQLKAYRLEYIALMQQKGSQGLSGARLQQYHQFLAQLDEAIEHQKTAIVDLEMTFVQTRAGWKDERSRAQAIDKAIQKLKVQEQKQIDKLEVNRADELSTQSWIRQHFQGNGNSNV